MVAGGLGLTQLLGSDHALQSAALAAADSAGDEMVLACLLHDLGHVLGRAVDWGLPGHAEVGARVLQPLLDSAISAVRLALRG